MGWPQLAGQPRMIRQSGRSTKRMNTLRGLTPRPSAWARYASRTTAMQPPLRLHPGSRGRIVSAVMTANGCGGVLMSMGQPRCEARRANRPSTTCRRSAPVRAAPGVESAAGGVEMSIAPITAEEEDSWPSALLLSGK